MCSKFFLRILISVKLKQKEIAYVSVIEISCTHYNDGISRQIRGNQRGLANKISQPAKFSIPQRKGNFLE